MPETTTPADAGLSHAAAQDHLLREVYAPVFFAKLAQDYGVQPADGAEAERFLRLAEKLQHVKAAQAPARSAGRGAFLDEVERGLDTLAKQAAPADHDVKAAAQGLLGDQATRDAALLYADALTQLGAQ